MLTIKSIFSAFIIIAILISLIQIVVYKYLKKNGIVYPESIGFRTIKYLRSWEKIIHNASVSMTIKVFSFIYIIGYVINLLLIIVLIVILFEHLFNG